LRILHVTPYSDQTWAYGGIPRVVGALATTQVRHGHHVTICTTDVYDEFTRLHSPDGRRWNPWKPIERSDGVVVRVFPNVSNRAAYRVQLFLPIGMRRFLERHAREFDVAHLHACRNVPGLLAARTLQRAGVPFVLAPNGTAPIIERRHGAKRAFDVVFGNRVIASASRVLAVSEAEHRQLVSAGVPVGAIRAVPNPIDLTEFTPPLPRGRLRGRLGLGDAPIVLFLGKLTPRKHVNVLIEAVARTREPVRLVVAGNDMGALGDAQSLVKRLGLGFRVVFTGLLACRERLEALADADVVAYVSEHEVFGLVPLEALLAGTPVVVGDDSGCGELIRSVGGGLVVPVGQSDPLASALEEVLMAIGDWRAAAAEAGVRVRSWFGEETVCRRLERVYEEVTSGAAAEQVA